MIKTIVLVAILFVGLQAFEEKDSAKEKQVPPKEKARVEQHQKDAVKSIILSVLPPQEEWPSPVQKFFLAFNMEEVIDPLRGNPDWIKIEDIPKNMQNALIAIEDHEFYNHGALAPESILRAMLANITEGEITQGGSTLTQQFVKNTFLTHEQTMERKIEEAILSLMLEEKYEKTEILEMYLNTTYFGAGATGIHQASRVYFGKHASRLSLPEAAVIAALPYAPSALNPLESPVECKQRQMQVLNAMAKYGFITQDEADEAKAEYVYLSNGTRL